MKFSVVIPLYKGSDFIKATLDTVLAQEYKDYEIVIVNDESPDNAGEIVKEYISAHSETRFIYIEQENRGLGGARNTAIRQSSGEIIAILDQDDAWYPGKLVAIAQIYRDNPQVDVVCHSQNIRKNGRVRGVFKPRCLMKDIYRELLFSNNRLSTSASTFKKTVIEDVGYFLEDKDNFHFVEDYDLWLRVARKGYVFYFTDDILGEYTRHSLNYSKQLGVMLKSEFNVLEKNLKEFKPKNILDKYLIRRRWALMYFRIAIKYLSSGILSKSARYFIRALIAEPFFITYYFNKIWQGLLEK